MKVASLFWVAVALVGLIQRWSEISFYAALIIATLYSIGAHICEEIRKNRT